MGGQGRRQPSERGRQTGGTSHQEKERTDHGRVNLNLYGNKFYNPKESFKNFFYYKEGYSEVVKEIQIFPYAHSIFTRGH